MHTTGNCAAGEVGGAPPSHKYLRGGARQGKVKKSGGASGMRGTPVGASQGSGAWPARNRASAPLQWGQSTRKLSDTSVVMKATPAVVMKATPA